MLPAPRRIRRTSLVAALFVVGCSEAATTSLTEPVARFSAPRRSSPLLSEYSGDGTRLTLVDDEGGMRYTLDLTTKEVTRSDGVILILPEELIHEVASAFEQSVTS